MLTFRVTQVLTGYRYFSEYLQRIGAEETTECKECGTDGLSPTYNRRVPAVSGGMP